MKWTRKKPDKPGWWWLRIRIGTSENSYFITKVFHVECHDSKLYVKGFGYLELPNGEWSDSPIPEGEKPAS